MNVQGIVDNCGLFLDCVIRYPGKVHDSILFRSSNLVHAWASGHVLQDPTLSVHIDGDTIKVPPVLLADSAYPQMPFVVKRYHTRRTSSISSEAERIFDRHHSLGRVVVENAWSRLKGRWPILRCLNVHMDIASKTIAACIALHNFLERLGDVVEDVYVEEQSDDEEAHVHDDFVLSKKRRDALKFLLMEDLGVASSV